MNNPETLATMESMCSRYMVLSFSFFLILCTYDPIVFYTNIFYFNGSNSELDNYIICSHHDIPEILLMLTLNTNQSNNPSSPGAQ